MTPSVNDLTAEATAMKVSDAPLAEIVKQLVDQGASRLDLVRVIKQIESVGHGDAARLLAQTGVLPDETFTVTVQDDDPFYAELFTQSPRL